MSKAKVLHITNWYPNPWHDHEGIFVREQFNVFSKATDSRLVNVQVRSGSKWFEYSYCDYSDSECGHYVLTKFQRSKVVHLISTILLLWVLNRENVNKYDLLHIHVAYPLLIHFHWWKRWLKSRVVISEHWTAYHLNFNLPKSTRKLEGIKKIFHQRIPVITVSKALLHDIQEFSGASDFKSYILPNVIDQNIFRYYDQNQQLAIPKFFMVNLWNERKNPYPVIDGFKSLSDEGLNMKLILGGHGSILSDMKEYVSSQGMSEIVEFPGSMTKADIVDTLKESDAYLCSSTYETFSVACAQALCCGVPLISPPIEAIMEYADESSMVSVENNNQQGWADAFRNFMAKKEMFCRREIAIRYTKKFSTESTMKNYAQIVDEVCGRINK